jgi:hypothetical protein
MVIESKAWVTMHSGRLAEGLVLFQEAARAFEDAGLPLGEHYVEYADALMDLRLLPEAGMAARAAAEVFRLNEVPLMGAEAELRVAQLAMLSGDLAEAETAAATAAASFQRQGRSTWKARAVLVRTEARLQAGVATAVDLRDAKRVADTLAALGTWSTAVHAHYVAGRIAAALGRTREAVNALLCAADLARSSPVLVRLRGNLAAALAAQLLRRDDEILSHCSRGLRDLARHRAALPSVELRALASGHGVELGQFGLEVVVRKGTARHVLEWMERTRAAALLTVEHRRAADSEVDIEEELEALRTVHAEQESWVGAHDRGATGMGSLLTKQVTIENRIRRATWHTSPGSAAATATIRLARLRELLGERVLIEYGILGEQLVAVVVEPRRSRVVALGSTEAVVEQSRALFFALRRLTQVRPEASLAPARLSADLRIERLNQLLVQPLHVPGDAETVVVPVGHLHDIPWSALHAGPVSLAPSARFWAQTREAAMRRRVDRSVVLVAGPHLPGATIEVSRLHRLHPHATVLTPPESTASAVLRHIDGADLVHLACHGWLRSDNPLFSSLVLSDGPLTVQELETRGVAPHRLVLASCQSGADVSYAGDEVLGFVSALLARGTAGIVASVAAVPDVSAVDLMCAMHEHLLKGRTLAHALFETRAHIDREDPAAYVSWCTFNAYGAA